MTPGDSFPRSGLTSAENLDSSVFLRELPLYTDLPDQVPQVECG